MHCCDRTLAAPLLRLRAMRSTLCRRQGVEPFGVNANVYVDAFNLYYGALKGTAYKWLDLDRLCRLSATTRIARTHPGRRW